ncbi:autotransporter adhesin [Burkholderia ambifaria]|nr:YadA-like family protein [Burkholderia ambifaria]MDR6504063.1 autotransporter adhesin [Burkholderia ambifaria]
MSSLSTTVSTATSATASLSTGLSATNSNVASLSTGVNSLSTGLSSLSTGVGNAVKYDDPAHAKVTLGGTSATAPVSLTNVAAGANPNDAVNYGQLSSLATTVNNINNGNSTYFKVNDPTAPASQASGNGAIAGGGGALASGDGSVALGKNTTAAGTNSVAIGAGSVANDPNTVSFGAPGGERRLTNIAPGVNPTDATTVQQVRQAVASGLSQANSYTDQRINATNNAINDLSRNAYSGIATAMAMSGMPDIDNNKSMGIGLSMSTYHGYQAIAGSLVGRLTENVKVRVGVGGSTGGGGIGGQIGGLYQW